MVRLRVNKRLKKPSGFKKKSKKAGYKKGKKTSFHRDNRKKSKKRRGFKGNDKMPAVSGVISRNREGYGFLIPFDPNSEDIYLPRNQMRNLMEGDEVEIEVFKKRNRFSGRLKRILKRKYTHVIGVCSVESHKKGCIHDKDSHFGSHLNFSLANHPEIKEGAWVQVKITSYPGSKLGFYGEVEGVIDSFKKANVDNLSCLQEFNIPYLFPPDVLQEKEAWLQKMKSAYTKNRINLKESPFVTIDGKTAKDFDDAVYVRKVKNGWVAYISIADVDFFVKQNTNLDEEAYKRGNSTYFPSFVSPMLPPFLSDDLCSLVPHEPRITMTVEIHFDPNARVLNHHFYESIICSRARLTYEQAQEIIDGKLLPSTSKEVHTSVLEAAALSKKLMKRRYEQGALCLEIPDTEIFLNEAGEPLDIKSSKRTFSHQVIEELMLACNKSVATFISQKKHLSIYRVHDIPDEDKLKHLYEFLHSSAEVISEPRDSTPISLQKKLSIWIEKLKGHSKESILHYLILRSLPQAYYSSRNIGHFGLSFSCYTHFTSPIRRYSDLIVHRILKTILGLNSTPVTSADEIQVQASHLCDCEQRSVKAERKIKDIKKARFMQRFLGEEFDGRILSIASFGFFVVLNKYDVDGLVDISSLGGRFNFNPVQMTLQSGSGYLFSQGDAVGVQVASSNIETGKIAFHLISHNKKLFKKSVFKRSSKRKRKKR